MFDREGPKSVRMTYIKMNKLLLLFFMVFFSTSCAQLESHEKLSRFPAGGRAEIGGGSESGGGGGDPYVAEFLTIGHDADKWLRQFSVIPVKEIAKLEASLEKLERSVNNVNLKALISFTDEKVVDQNFVPKAAFYDPNRGTVLLQRSLWKSFNDKERRELVMIELLGLSGSKLRYTLVSHFSKKLNVESDTCRNFGFVSSVLVYDRSEFGKLDAADIEKEVDLRKNINGTCVDVQASVGLYIIRNFVKVSASENELLEIVDIYLKN